MWENRVKSVRRRYFSINRSKTTRARQSIHIGYDAASNHDSEVEPLPPTKDRKETSPPRSIPPLVRRANPMVDT